MKVSAPSLLSPQPSSDSGERQHTLAGDTARQATSGEVKDLRAEALALKEVVADLTLENRLLKKNTTGVGGEHE